jgi:hypothetical protein
MACDGSKNYRHEKNDGSWWDVDSKGIPTDRVCDKCIEAKRSKYRPIIFEGYGQADVDEPIEEDAW